MVDKSCILMSLNDDRYFPKDIASGNYNAEDIDSIHYHFSDDENIVDIELLLSCPNLKWLEIAGPYSDFSFLRRLTGLVNVELCESEFTDMTLLEGCRDTLKELSLCDMKALSIEGIRNYRSLKYLDIGGIYIDDISELGHLTQLETLHLPSGVGSGMQHLAHIQYITVPFEFNIGRTNTVPDCILSIVGERMTGEQLHKVVMENGLP